MMYLKIAWLNIWRNKRRTFITTASVFFAVLLAIVIRSVTDGVYENMIHNIVSYASGYLQVHQRGYWEEQSVDNSFEDNTLLIQELERHAKIVDMMPRFETFALASVGEKSKVVMLLGIDPAREMRVNNLHEKITEGQYLSSRTDTAILVGQGLASQLKLQINDTLVLIGQGYHASTAAAKFRVKGILKLGSPELNNSMVYLPLQQAQYMHSADDRLTALSIMISQGSDLNKLKMSMYKELDTSRYEVMTWKEMMPEMDQFIEADSAGHYIIIGIFYVIISFGLFGTLLMMSFERTREFGILISIGMKKQVLAGILLMESLLISLIGCMAGVIAGIILISWFSQNPIYFSGVLKEIYENYGIEPIIYFSSSIDIFIVQTLIVLTLSLLLAFYPGFKVLRLKPVEALNT